MNSDKKETTRYLLALAEQHHFSLTADQLRRLHLEDMIVRPIQEYSVGKVGSETVYPAGTGKLLLAICALHQQKRSFTAIAWQLWWDGYAIPLARIRTDLREAAQQWEKMRNIVSYPGIKRLSKLARKFLRESVSHRLKDPVLSQARKRVGTVSFDTFSRIFLEIATGDFQGYKDDGAGSRDEEQEIMAKGFGLNQTPLDRAHGINWTTNLEQSLIELSKFVADDPWRPWLDEVSDDELLRNWADFRFLLMVLEDLGTAIEDLAGKRAVGGLVLYQALGRGAKRALPFSFLAFSLIRRWLPTETGELLKAAQQWAQEGQLACVVLRQLRTEVSAIRPLLTPRRGRQMMQSSRTQERHIAELRLFYEQHRDELMAFWGRHQEWYEAIVGQHEAVS